MSAGGVSLTRNPPAPARRGAQDVVVGVEGREDDDLGRVRLRAQQLGGREAVGAWHPDVHQHHVGLALGHRMRDLSTVRGLPDISRSAAPARSIDSPARTSASSSTTSTRMRSPTQRAIELGAARTGKLVTSAALILMFAFLVLSSSPGPETKELAIGLAAGIIFDATVFRALLVPALVRLLGRANWWMPQWSCSLLRIRERGAVRSVA
jgi:MMPL family protein